MLSGTPEVVAEVLRLLDRKGSISVEEAMEIALYHPRGLYRRGLPPSGKTGHFTTCARLDPALGQAVARWLLEGRRELLGPSPRWHVIEVGGGDGSLAEAVLDALSRRARLGLVLHMVERSEPAVAAQRERLGRRARWHPSVAAALDAAGGRALIYSNELVDAFPVAVIERRGDLWREVRLVREGAYLVETLGDEPAWLPEERPRLERHAPPREGRRVELHRSYERWLGLWAPRLRRGAVLTIDYGDEADERAVPTSMGTLRAYFANTRLTETRDVFSRLGQQDLTCDVDFTALRERGEARGWRTRALWTQREFLARTGALDEAADRITLSFIANPEGAGQAFRVLWQEAR